MWGRRGVTGQQDIDFGFRFSISSILPASALAVVFTPGENIDGLNTALNITSLIFKYFLNSMYFKNRLVSASGTVVLAPGGDSWPIVARQGRQQLGRALQLGPTAGPMWLFHW